MKKNKKQILIVLLIVTLSVVSYGLAGCGAVEVGAVDAGSEEDGAIQIGVEPTPMPQMLSYMNYVYGFKFSYPETWTRTEIDHGVVLMKGTNRLGINFRWAEGDIQHFGRTGFGGGDLIYSGKVNFMGQVIPENTVELDHLAKYVLYNDTSLIEIDNLVFGIVLEDLITDYMSLDISDEIIAEARTILESFEPIEATGSPGEIPPISSDHTANWLVNENRIYRFAYSHPPYMSIFEKPNYMRVENGALHLEISYRHDYETIPLSDNDTLTGEWQPYSEVLFMGKLVQVMLNSHDGKVTAVYLGGPGVELGEETRLRFVISLVNIDGEEITSPQIDLMMQIIKSFRLAD
jgi:hypothetical protein